MIKSICQLLAKYLPSETIWIDKVAGKKYLTRYYLLLKDRKWCNIYLHQFHNSDMDKGISGWGLLHSHPWKYSYSFILINGYVEERRLANDLVVSRVFRPGHFNFLRYSDFHRVDLLAEDSWSIFFTTSRGKYDWFFWDRISKELIPWRKMPNAIP